MKFFKNLSYKVKLISIYITTTVVGVILVLMAIFNAYMELELLHKSENMHQIFGDHFSSLDSSVGQQSGVEEMMAIAKDMTTDKYKVAVIADDMVLQPVSLGKCNSDITRFIQSDGVSANYGYVVDENCTVNWTLIPVGNSGYHYLVLHEFSEHSLASLYHAYVNRLIIPVAFFIWLTVWGSLILGNLVNRLEKQREEVKHLALHDALTGLPNRNYFSEKVHEILNYSKRENKKFVLGLIDLNKFKEVNDGLGHNYGDELLKQVAQRIKNVLREYDVVARVGGDEFILLLPDTSAETSSTILERIYTMLVMDYSVLGETVQIGASIGVAYFPQHETDYTELLHKADSAMYLAKQTGGGVKVFHPEV